MRDPSEGTYVSPHRFEQQLPHPTTPHKYIRHPSADLRHDHEPSGGGNDWMRSPQSRRNDPSFVEVKPEVWRGTHRFDVQGSMGCVVPQGRGNHSGSDASEDMPLTMVPGWLRSVRYRQA